MTLLAEPDEATTPLTDVHEALARPDNRPIRSEMVGIMALTAAALALRLIRLGHQSLWMDEALEVLIGSMGSPVKMIHAVASGLDKNPPAYHLLMWGWLHLGLGHGAAYVRLPSVVASTSLVPATWILAKRLAWRARWLASFFMAVSPFALYYGQEARMYALAGALAAWSVVAFLSALDHPEQKRLWVAYGVLRVLAAYTHPYTLALNGPEIVAAARAGRLERRSATCSMGAQAVLFLPWMSVLWGLRSASAGFSKPLSPLAFGYTGFAFLFGYSLGPTLAQLHEGVRAAGVAVVAVPGGIAVAAAVMAWVRGGNRRTLVAGYVATLVGGAFAVAALTHVTFNVRYVIAALPFVLVVVADGLMKLPGRVVRVVAGLLIALLTVVSLGNWWLNPAYAKEDFRDATAFVTSHYTPGDSVVLVTSPEPFMVYTANRIPFVTLYQDGARDEVEWAKLQGTTLRAGTVWMMRARPWEADPDGAVLAWFLRQGRVSARYHAPGVDVYAIVSGPGSRPEPGPGPG